MIAPSAFALRRLAKNLAAMLAFAAAGFFIVWLMWVTRAEAHEAPKGWAYPFSCCANHDCRPLSAAETEGIERPEGYVIPGTGEIVPMTDRRVRPSPDGLFHWCAHQAGIDAGRTICLFAPPRGS